MVTSSDSSGNSSSAALIRKMCVRQLPSEPSSNSGELGPRSYPAKSEGLSLTT
ncbi:hypothetical protein D3C87_1463940 [compost metagenome]